MPVGTPYKQANLAEAWDAIVVGSGIGGLTAAFLLARHGRKRVLLLERHYEVGGFTHTFRRPGFHWDVGLHYIGQMSRPGSSLRRIFDHITGGAVQWHPMPAVYDRIRIRDREFEFTAGLQNFRAGLLRAFPSEAGAIDAYLAAVASVNRRTAFFFAEKGLPGFLAAPLGGLLRAPYLRWARRTTLDVLRGITSNPELIGVLTAQWGDYGLPPAQSSFAAHAAIAQHYFEGGSYPIGGAATIAEAMVPLIVRLGGMAVHSADVSSILLDRGRASGVRLADGRELRAPLVLSDAGATNTFDKLLPPDLPATQSLRQKLHRLPPSTAHLSLYVGLSRSDADLGLTGTNLWIYPGFDHDANVAAFSRDLNNPFAGVYISFPSSKDPESPARLPGKSTIEAITMVPYGTFERWSSTRWKRRGEEYDALKSRLAERLQSVLLQHVPAAAGHIACAELSTPLSTRHFMNYDHGEIYGIAATPERFLLRELGARTPVPGLFLAGQDASMLGVVGAMFGGILGASAALGKNLMFAVQKGTTS